LRLEQGILWLSQTQFAELSNKDSGTIRLQMQNMHGDGEVSWMKSANHKQSSGVRQQDKRQVMNMPVTD